MVTNTVWLLITCHLLDTCVYKESHSIMGWHEVEESFSLAVVTQSQALVHIIHFEGANLVCHIAEP